MRACERFQLAIAFVYVVGFGALVEYAQVTTPPRTSVTLTEGPRCEAESLSLRSTVLGLRAELAKAQARIAELEAPLVEQAVERERAALEAKWRDALKVQADAVFDWRTFTFSRPAPAAPGK